MELIQLDFTRFQLSSRFDPVVNFRSETSRPDFEKGPDCGFDWTGPVRAEL